MKGLAGVVAVSSGHLCLFLGAAVATEAAGKLVAELARLGATSVSIRRDHFIESGRAVVLNPIGLGPRSRWGGLA